MHKLNEIYIIAIVFDSRLLFTPYFVLKKTPITKRSLVNKENLAPIVGFLDGARQRYPPSFEHLQVSRAP